ncbi:MAG: ribonuclease P protein component [Syntrophobacterales bacterium]|jgi:ribonuclease P protein component|nr:ribonuclease P protein component [Syntrophobacterales bacterium]
MAYTLTKNELLKKGDFRGIRWVKRGETTHFLILCNKNRPLTRRIAIGIRKKTGGAVVRNKMKRHIKEFFRLHKELFPGHRDTLIKVKKIPYKIEWKNTSEELRQLLLNVKIR